MTLARLASLACQRMESNELACRGLSDADAFPIEVERNNIDASGDAFRLALLHAMPEDVRDCVAVLHAAAIIISLHVEQWAPDHCGDICTALTCGIENVAVRLLDGVEMDSFSRGDQESARLLYRRVVARGQLAGAGL